jgi:hypothetical protein
MFHTHRPRFSLITATASYFATDFYQIVFCIEQFDDFIYGVIHSQTMVADAFATAMMAMGSQSATVLAKQRKISSVNFYHFKMRLLI